LMTSGAKSNAKTSMRARTNVRSIYIYLYNVKFK
jgi:DNA-binding CsgD family transcriptional regulator